MERETTMFSTCCNSLKLAQIFFWGAKVKAFGYPNAFVPLVLTTFSMLTAVRLSTYEAGMGNTVLASSQVHHLLPDHVVGLLGARLRGAVLDTFQNDSCVSSCFLAHSGVEGGCAAQWRPQHRLDGRLRHSGTVSVGGNPKTPAQKS